MDHYSKFDKLSGFIRFSTKKDDWLVGEILKNFNLKILNSKF